MKKYGVLYGIKRTIVASRGRSEFIKLNKLTFSKKEKFTKML